MMAAVNGHESAVRVLLEHRASVEAATQVVTWERWCEGCMGGKAGGGA